MQLTTQNNINNPLISFALNFGKVHHGKYLKKLVEFHDPNREQLAKTMGVSRYQLYNLYDYEKIPWGKLLAAGKFMGHDIWKDIPDAPIPQHIVNEDPEEYKSYSVTKLLVEKGDLQRQLIEAQTKLNSCQEELILLQKKLLDKKPKK